MKWGMQVPLFHSSYTVKQNIALYINRLFWWPMYLKLDGLKIKGKHLSTLNWSGLDIIFYGVALEEDGKRICDLLSKFKEGQIVEVDAELENYQHFEGVCEVVKITLPPPTLDKAPAIYRFEGRLQPVR